MAAWAFAAQAAIALQHARLFEATEREPRERTRTQEALAKSEASHRDLFDHCLGLICTHDLDGNILSTNPAAAHALGYSIADLRGRNLRVGLTRLRRQSRYAATFAAAYCFSKSIGLT